ncbi:MAG: EAL domain-containing protein [Lachnospiraceae bacterium]|nr:EAL domain-containing protein [Lachnospiraceae bacterium]
MRNYNDGIVRTNKRCIGCNKCVSKCPVVGANVSVLKKGRPTMAVSSDKCINCGNCVEVCNKQAREFIDDTEDFFKAVRSDLKVSVLIDPSFYILYKDKANGILGYLKESGVNKIYDVGFGAEIAAYMNAQYIKEHEDDPKRAFILNYCPAVVSYIERYRPEMIDMMIPVQSPAISTAIYVKKYLKDDSALALISPCPSKKDEMLSTGNLISYNVCISNFIKELEGINTDAYVAQSDLPSRDVGVLSSVTGFFGEMIDIYFSKEYSSLRKEGIDGTFFDFVSMTAADETPMATYFDIISCQVSCLMGPGISIPMQDYEHVNKTIRELRKKNIGKLGDKTSSEEIYKADSEIMKDLDPADFVRTYQSKFRQESEVPESTYESIFNTMYKTTPEKRNVDCGSCGYSTCREMVGAIAYGYNRMENCIHYMNDELLMRYYTDDLTKIANVEGFKANVKRLYDENPQKEYVIGVVSLNHLNLINDLYGFSLGDAYIKKAAEIAVKFTSKGGTAGRLGGGEFLICFENSEEELKRADEATTYSFPDINVSFPLSFRAGLYIDRFRDETIEAIINFASLARDKIEEDGVSTILIYDDELQEKLAAEAMITSQMYKAITKKEFAPFFQPQYSHRTGKIVGAEMLCRWIKKDGSIISPGLFIPIFEKNGFIKTLDKYMWEQAFIAAQNYSSDKYKKVPVSVNISRVSLDEDDFVDTIRKLDERYPIDKSGLHFEITESAYSSRQDIVSRKVNELRKMGFKVAVDDFGSGYSSLNILKDMPIDILKLDMGFLRGRNQENGEIIIRNVVSMVKELDLEIISEGVENIEQAEFLKYVGCDTIQGYLYARPMPAKEYEKLILADASDFNNMKFENEMKEKGVFY